MKTTMILFLTVLLLLKLEIVKSHKCGVHLEENQKKVLIHREMIDNKVWKPIQIHFDYSFIEERKENFNLDKVNFLVQQVMPRVAAIFKKLLQVHPYEKNLTLSDNPCGKVANIPQKYLKVGLITDLIVFVTFFDESQKDIQASASFCFQDEDSYRPVAGFIKFNPNFEINNSTSLDYMTTLTIHEMTHILLMNPGLYARWKTENNGRIKRYNRSGATRIKTPEVLRQSRIHFNCSTMKGLPLEDEGDKGTVGSHWDENVMSTDYMTGSNNGENLISNITLAAFYDSGWYLPDFNLADTFLFGKNQGCKFIDASDKCVKIECLKLEDNSNKCLTEKITKLFENSFCTEINQPICSINHQFRAICSKKSSMQNCPIPIEDTDIKYYHGGSCRDGSSLSITSFETIGPKSACFLSNLQDPEEKDDPINQKKFANKTRISFLEKKIENRNNKKSKFEKSADNFKAMCFEFRCSKEGEIYFKIKKKEYKCIDNNSIKITEFSSEVKCPPKEVLCGQKYFWKFGYGDKILEIETPKAFLPGNIHSNITNPNEINFPLKMSDSGKKFNPSDIITNLSQFSIPMVKYFSRFFKHYSCLDYESVRKGLKQKNTNNTFCGKLRRNWKNRLSLILNVYVGDIYKKIAVVFGDKFLTPRKLFKFYSVHLKNCTNLKIITDKKCRNNFFPENSPIYSNLPHLEKILMDPKHKDYQIIFIGHSVLALSAINMANSWASKNQNLNQPVVLITYGQIVAGNKEFNESSDMSIPLTFRVVHKEDASPTYPREMGGSATSLSDNVNPAARAKDENPTLPPYVIPNIGNFYMINKKGKQYTYCSKEKILTQDGINKCKVSTTYDRYSSLFYFNENIFDADPKAEYNSNWKKAVMTLLYVK